MSGPLRRGSQGPVVRQLQQGFNTILPALQPLVPDGIFGTLTEGRVKDYQRLVGQGLVADGVVGPLTLERLIRAERLQLKVSINRLAGGDDRVQAARPGFQLAPPRRLGVGPGFTPFHYDARDAQWAMEVREFLTWMGGPSGSRPPPKMPSLLPPSSGLLGLPPLQLPFPPVPLPPPPPPIFLEPRPTFPSVPPWRQVILPGNAAPRLFDGLDFGGSTEIKFETGGTFDPFNKAKRYKLDMTLEASIFRFEFLGGRGEGGIGPQVSFLDEHPFKAQASVDLKIFKWEPFKDGLSPSIGLGLSSALTLPSLELEAAAKLKAGMVWRPTGRLKGVEAFLGLGLASKLKLAADDEGAFSIQGMPVLPGLIFSISASDK